MAQPSVFISYSWSSDEHTAWVVNLASQLRANGVNAILDKWDLKEGNDPHSFMERMVTDPDVSRVLMICDQTYCEKADTRRGGVGTEAQIISPEIYASTTQDKFVAVVKELAADGTAYLPAFYGKRIYIDLSDDDLHGSNFEQLLRWIFGKPLYVKPPIGNRPRFLDGSTEAVSGNAGLLAIATKAIRANDPRAAHAIEDFLASLLRELEDQALPLNTADDEIIWNSIEAYRVPQSQMAELLSVLSRTAIHSNITETLISFLEKVAQLQEVPADTMSWTRSCRDNMIFLASELFLIIATKLLSRDRFDELNEILSAIYVYSSNGRSRAAETFTIFNQYPQSFEGRNRRLNLNRISLKGDLLIDRSIQLGIDPQQLVQTDFILSFRRAVDLLKKSEKYARNWHPHTLVYKNDEEPFEKFLRSTSRAYFDRFRLVLGLTSLDHFKGAITASTNGTLDIPRQRYSRLDVAQLTNASSIAGQS